MFWAVWKTRNKAGFENILPTDPGDIINLISHFLIIGGELQKSRIREDLRQVSELVKKTTKRGDGRHYVEESPNHSLH
jgi:hypothetical protein